MTTPTNIIQLPLATKPAAKTIKPGQVLTARSICDHECIYKITILERRGKFVTFLEDRSAEVKRKIVKLDHDGDEYVMAHGTHSMAPMFRAIN